MEKKWRSKFDAGIKRKEIGLPFLGIEVTIVGGVRRSDYV